jgi:hypothetical protein
VFNAEQAAEFRIQNKRMLPKASEVNVRISAIVDSFS